MGDVEWSAKDANLQLLRKIEKKLSSLIWMNLLNESRLIKMLKNKLTFQCFMEYFYELKVPKSRVAVLIGKEGSTKKDIEESTKTRLDIDSKEGDVSIHGEDGLGLYIAKEVIKAVSRGFNPDIAKLLLKPDYVFEIIEIGEYAKSKDAILRLKGRVIGKEGKSRRLLEELTGCHISIFGKTVSIIGKTEESANAKHAVESLLRGSPHSNVYRWLEGRRGELKKRAQLDELDV